MDLVIRSDLLGLYCSLC